MGEAKTSVPECSMSIRPFPTLTAPTIHDNIYTWEDGPVVKITLEDIQEGYGKFALKNPVVQKWVGSLQKFGDIDFTEDVTKKLIVAADEEEIEIKYVFLGEGTHICTKSVSAVLYAVLDYINTKHLYPERGKVYIESSNGCAAFNCYNRSFRMNGFALTKQSLEEYETIVKPEANDRTFMHTLYFYSDEQHAKKEFTKTN